MTKDKSWTLENAAEIQREAPYTFYKPSDKIINQLKPGEATVKLIFRFESDEPDVPSAERMWVIIDEKLQDGSFIGTLDNDPFHIKDLNAGDKIQFRAEHIIQYDTRYDLGIEDMNGDEIEKYLKKCFVSNHILNENYRVGRLYREKPEADNETGWTFMSDYETQEYVDNADNLKYMAIGKVLNLDDSFIHLLDAPIGSEFVKDDITGSFFSTQE